MNQDQINELLEKLASLQKRQEDFSQQIHQLQSEIEKLKTPSSAPSTPAATATPRPAGEVHYIPPKEPVRPAPGAVEKPAPAKRSDLEKFIGENLINKIGIVITVIGVAIGAKYAIDHDMISPLSRIMLGYLVGLGLLGFAIRLKKNYENFSAVLLGGAMAILYFITYSAYSLYALVPQLPAFILMLIFTVFTVVAALHYNRQVIAHLGLVGAYAIPFLLSEGSGKVAVLFTYITVINGGILFIAFKKYWKPLYHVAFSFTWLIYFSWFLVKYEYGAHFGLAFAFLAVFFLLFYATFLAYKLIRKEQFGRKDILFLLLNSFIFYGLGYALINGRSDLREWLGLFTVVNALIHFCIAAVIYRQKLADRKLFYLVAGLVLVFLTIAIPVQLDGNWVTLFWAAEAALLFWVGRTKNSPLYEKLSYPLMLLAFISLWHDWTGYRAGSYTAVFNIYFLSSAFCIAAFLFINLLHINKKYPSPLQPRKALHLLISYTIPALLLITTYYAFHLEIWAYFARLREASALYSESGDLYIDTFDYDLVYYQRLWLVNYALFFLTTLSFINIRKLKIVRLAGINLMLNALGIILFLLIGLYQLSELRESYILQEQAQYYDRGISNLLIRYVSFLFAGGLIYVSYQYFKSGMISATFDKAFDLMLHATVLWVLSSELIHWMDLSYLSQSYKLGLSILWGVYALFLISRGIRKNKKHLRVGGFVLFGSTLIKLFFYDIAHLDTIDKTVVFVSLGILLLIISFLYNKYKNVMSDETK